MTRKKKSRKMGQIGVRKQESRPESNKPDVRKKKNPKGQKSGTRNSLLVEKVEKLDSTGKVKKDPKHGSKKKISLVAKVETQPKEQIVHAQHKPQVNLEKVDLPKLSPEQELEQIENDARLIELAERVEDGELLTGKDAKYFNKHMSRHQELMEELGLDDEDEEETDPMAQLGGDEWDDFLEGDDD